MDWLHWQLGGCSALFLLFQLAGLPLSFAPAGIARCLSLQRAIPWTLLTGFGGVSKFLCFRPIAYTGSLPGTNRHLVRMVFIFSISLGFLATAFIHVNDMRDAESDAQAGKHTLASLLGLPLSRTLYILLLLGAYAPIGALGLPHHAPHLLLLVLWTLPGLVIVITGILRTASPASLNVIMHRTLTLEVFFTSYWLLPWL